MNLKIVSFLNPFASLCNFLKLFFKMLSVTFNNNGSGNNSRKRIEQITSWLGTLTQKLIELEILDLFL